MGVLGLKTWTSQQQQQFQIDELLENQKYILDAVQNLNKSFLSIETKVDDDKLGNINNIVETQRMFDKIIVKNSDDIESIKKTREKNEEVLKGLKSKIFILDDELQKRCQKAHKKVGNNYDEIRIDNQKRVFRHFNKRYCRHKSGLDNLKLHKGWKMY